MKSNSVALLLVFLFSLLFLHANGRALRNGETVPNRFLPLTILRDHTFRLDAFPLLANEKDYYAVVRDKENHLISKKTALPALFMTPFFAADRLWSGHWPEDEEEMIALGKDAMSVFAALASLFLSAALLHSTQRRSLALIAGFGLVGMTTFWFAGQGAWPHALLGLFNAATLYLLVAHGNKRSGWLGIGILQGMAIAGRIGCIPVALLFAVLSCIHSAENPGERRRRLLLFCLGAMPSLLFLGIYNTIYFGYPWSTAFGGTRNNMLRLPFEGLAGQLISPGNGLLLFCPVLFLAFLALRRDVRCRLDVKVSATAAFVHLLYWSTYVDWWGGSAWGPRYVLEALPFVVFLAAVGLDAALSQIRWKRTLATIALFLSLLSLSIQVVGLFKWDNTYHQIFDPGFWVNDGDHWAWKAQYEPLWTLRTLPWQPPGWLQEE